MKNSLLPFHSLYPDSAPTKFWDSPSGPIAYDDVGTGPLVLCVPGMGDVRHEYRFLVPPLVSAGYRVVTVDLRGHGDSTVNGTDFSVAAVADDLAGLLAHLDAGQAHVLSCSMGGGASVCLAADHPDLVGRLVLLAPFVRNEPDGMTKFLYTVLFGGPWGPSMWVAYFDKINAGRRPEDFDAYKAALRSHLAEPGRMRVLLAMLKASKAASSSRLSLVRSPSLVIMGSKDPDFPNPEAEATWIAQQLRGTRAVLEGSGHYPQIDAPEDTAGLVLKFLSEWP